MDTPTENRGYKVVQAALYSDADIPHYVIDPCCEMCNYSPTKVV